MAKWWRADSGYRHERDTLIRDVVAYEVGDLGNNIHLNIELYLTVWMLPASQCLWATRSKRAAAHYGEPERLELVGEQILGSDDCGGYLLVLGASK